MSAATKGLFIMSAAALAVAAYVSTEAKTSRTVLRHNKSHLLTKEIKEMREHMDELKKQYAKHESEVQEVFSAALETKQVVLDATQDKLDEMYKALQMARAQNQAFLVEEERETKERAGEQKQRREEHEKQRREEHEKQRREEQEKQRREEEEKQRQEDQREEEQQKVEKKRKQKERGQEHKYSELLREHTELRGVLSELEASYEQKIESLESGFKARLGQAALLLSTETGNQQTRFDTQQERWRAERMREKAECAERMADEKAELLKGMAEWQRKSMAEWQRDNAEGMANEKAECAERMAEWQRKRMAEWQRENDELKAHIRDLVSMDDGDSKRKRSSARGYSY